MTRCKACGGAITKRKVVKRLSFKKSIVSGGNGSSVREVVYNGRATGVFAVMHKDICRKWGFGVKIDRSGGWTIHPIKDGFQTMKAAGNAYLSDFWEDD